MRFTQVVIHFNVHDNSNEILCKYKVGPVSFVMTTLRKHSTSSAISLKLGEVCQ